MNTKAIVCTKANAYIKEGYNRSHAFRMAWAEVKLEQANNALECSGLLWADRFTADEKVRVDELRGAAARYQFLIQLIKSNKANEDAIANGNYATAV